VSQGKLVQQRRFPMIYFWLKDYYFQRSPDNFKDTTWNFYDDDQTIIEREDIQQQLLENPPDIVGISLYMWNIDRLLSNARWIKERFPNTMIIAAGPSADATPEFFTENNFIDAIILGPGVESFRQILDCKFNNTSINDVLGIAYFKNNTVIKTEPMPRSQEPFILNFVGNFKDEVKELLDRYTKEYDRIIFLTAVMQGCPYSCSFCEQGTSLWTKMSTRPLDYMYEEIDLLVTYKNILYEFIDTNFGITKDYEKVIDYAIEKNVNGYLKFDRPTMAKNNVETTFYLLDKMFKHGIMDYSDFAYIALQDTNEDVLRLNGRPPSKEFQKIEQFKIFTQNQKHKTNEVDIILGMPGQSFESLTGTLADLLVHELLSHHLPGHYAIFPNTRLTSPDNKIYYRKNKVYIRTMAGMQTALIERDVEKEETKLDYLIETETLSVSDLMHAHYMISMMCHVHGFLGWSRTPLNYLKNYYGIDNLEFVKKYAEYFNPINKHRLPESIRKDLEYVERWFVGDDKFFQLKDNRDKNFCTPKQLPVYRFHANYDEVSDFFRKIFVELADCDNDPHFNALMDWIGAKTLMFEPSKCNHSLITYNYDDIASCNSNYFYKSKFEFTFDTEDFDDLYNQMLKVENISYIPKFNVSEISDENQIKLNINDIRNH